MRTGSGLPWMILTGTVRDREPAGYIRTTRTANGLTRVLGLIQGHLRGMSPRISTIISRIARTPAFTLMVMRKISRRNGEFLLQGERRHLAADFPHPPLIRASVPGCPR